MNMLGICAVLMLVGAVVFGLGTIYFVFFEVGATSIKLALSGLLLTVFASLLWEGR